MDHSKDNSKKSPSLRQVQRDALGGLGETSGEAYKILVIQQKMIGDVLTSSILFEVLRHKYPKAQLDYLINSHTYPVVEHSPYINNFVFYTKQVEQNKLAFIRLVKSIRRVNYDVIIDVYSKWSSNIISLFSGAKTKISYHKSYTSFIYQHTVKRQIKSDKASLAIVNRMQLLEPLGIKPSDFPKPKIYLSENEKTKAKQFLKSKGVNLDKPLFMISVLGSMQIKTYPFEFMAKIINQIVDSTNGQVLFNYIPNQKKDVENIYKLCKPETQKHIFKDIYGKSLSEFLAITHFSNALIGNEGGATNMAKALDIPTFTIFSPWIDKDTWNQFDNGFSNVSVHLKDYHPEFYEDIEEYKELKRESLVLYQKFKPEFFLDKLKIYLEQF